MLENVGLGGNLPNEPISTGTAVGGIDNSGNFQYLQIINGVLTVSSSGSSTLTFTPSSMFRNASLSNTPTAIKLSAGNITGWHLYNPGTNDAFMQLYDALVVSVTPGVTTPNKTLWVPAGGALDNIDGNPIGFKIGITVAVTTSITGGGAPTTGILANVDFI